MNEEKDQVAQKTSTLAIVSLVMTFFIPLIGLILGAVALVKIGKSKEAGKGLAIASIVISTLFILSQMLIIGLIIVGASVDTESSRSTSTSQSPNKQARFEDRADKQAQDLEAEIGESAIVDGRKLTIESVEKNQSLGEFTDAGDGKTFVVTKVTIENVSDEVKAYNIFDFRIQTVSGQVLDPSFYGTDNLESGDLVAGGKVSGTVTYEVPVETGNQYIIYKPNATRSTRAIVRVP